MLTQIRKNLHGAVAWIILSIIAVVFIFFGAVGLRAGGEKYIDVNGEKLYPNEIEVFSRIYPNSSLPQLTLIKQHLNNIGFYVSDNQLDKILKQIPYFQKDGKFSEEIYDRFLKRRTLEVELIRKATEFNSLSQQLYYALQKTLTVYPNTLERYYQLMDQKRNVSAFTVSTDSLSKNISIDNKEIQEFYEKNKNSFKISEEVKLDYIKINYGEILSETKTLVLDKNIEQYYKVNKNEFIVPAKKKISQLVINNNTANKAKISDVKDLLYKANPNKISFADIVKKYSDDVITAKEGGDIGWYTQGDMSEEVLDKAINKLVKNNEVTQPIEFNGKIYIFKQIDQKAKYNLNYADVKDEIKSRLAAEKANDKYAELKEKLELKSFEIADSLELVAEDLNLKMSKSNWISKDKISTSTQVDPNNNNLFDNQKVMTAVFSNDVYNERNNSNLLEISPDSSMVLRVSEIKPSRLKELSEAKDEIKNIIKQQKSEAQASKIIDDVWQEFTSNGSDITKLQTIADSSKYKNNSGVKVQKSKEVTYMDTFWSGNKNNNIASSKVLVEAFDLPKPDKNFVVQAKQIKLDNGDKAIVAINKVLFGSYTDASTEDLSRAKNQLKYFVFMRDNLNFSNTIADKLDKNVKSYL